MAAPNRNGRLHQMSTKILQLLSTKNVVFWWFPIESHIGFDIHTVS